MKNIFHGYDIRLCFLIIWANFTIWMWSGCCVFSTFGPILSWIWCKLLFPLHLGQFLPWEWCHDHDVSGLCFLSIWGLFPMDMIYCKAVFSVLYIWQNFTMGMMSGGCVFCPYEVFFPWKWWHKTVFSDNMGQFYHGNDVRVLFSVPLMNFFVMNTISDCVFSTFWLNFILGMMSGGLFFCPYKEFFPWIWCKAVFSKHMGPFYHGNDVRGLCFCPYEEFFSWIWYKILFSGNLGQFYHGNDVRGLCFLSIWGMFTIDMM